MNLGVCDIAVVGTRSMGADADCGDQQCQAVLADKADISAVNSCLEAKANKASVANALHRKVRLCINAASS